MQKSAQLGERLSSKPTAADGLWATDGIDSYFQFVKIPRLLRFELLFRSQSPNGGNSHSQDRCGLPWRFADVRCKEYEAACLVLAAAVAVGLCGRASVCGVAGLEHRLRSDLADFVVGHLQPTVGSIEARHLEV